MSSISPGFYPIGTPGQPWGAAEKAQWRARQGRSVSYADDVVPRLDALRDGLRRARSTASWTMPGDHYPLFAVRSRDWNAALPSALVTGGVHGYETSGVQGALQFLDQHAAGLRRPRQCAGGAVREPVGL